MQYRYPDGNEVVFVMFIFNATVDLEGKTEDQGRILIYHDVNNESLQLEFKAMHEIDLEDISTVQRPVFEDLQSGKSHILRT